MLDLGGQPPVVAKPQPDMKSTDAPSHATEIFAAALVGLVLVATLGIYFLSRAEASALKKADQTYQELDSALRSEPLATIGNQARHIAAALAVVRSADSGQASWSNLLKDMQTTTISGISLTQVSVDQKGLAKIEGRAASYDQIASYLATVSASTFVTEADLISTARVEDQKGIYFPFVISVQLDRAALAAGRAA